jgi:hypothetical protein
VQVCPVACIPKDPAHAESHETLMQKYIRLTVIDPALANLHQAA